MDYQTWEVEKRAGVHDDVEHCPYCGTNPCRCDEIYETHVGK